MSLPTQRHARNHAYTHHMHVLVHAHTKKTNTHGLYQTVLHTSRPKTHVGHRHYRRQPSPSRSHSHTYQPRERTESWMDGWMQRLVSVCSDNSAPILQSSPVMSLTSQLWFYLIRGDTRRPAAVASDKRPKSTTASTSRTLPGGRWEWQV